MVILLRFRFLLCNGAPLGASLSVAGPVTGEPDGDDREEALDVSSRTELSGETRADLFALIETWALPLGMPFAEEWVLGVPDTCASEDALCADARKGVLPLGKPLALNALPLGIPLTRGWVLVVSVTCAAQGACGALPLVMPLVWDWLLGA